MPDRAAKNRTPDAGSPAGLARGDGNDRLALIELVRTLARIEAQRDHDNETRGDLCTVFVGPSK